jgi:ABC-type branched-subunit amino acid transport system ATPase component
MILSIQNVSKNFGGIRALSGCSLEVQKGLITAIIGPNGSGKTTLFNSITGLIPIDTGGIYFEGLPITSLQTYRISQLGISRTFQDVRLFRNLTIREHLQIALSVTDQDLFHNIIRGEEIGDEKISGVLDWVSLDKPLDTVATDLSYGQRKLLDLAIAIGKPHSLLMLDEPVAGVNPLLRDGIKKILRELNRSGETILLIEHDMNFVMDLVDHIFVMDQGGVIAQGSPDEVQNNPLVLEAYLGRS